MEIIRGRLTRERNQNDGLLLPPTLLPHMGTTDDQLGMGAGRSQLELEFAYPADDPTRTRTHPPTKLRGKVLLSGRLISGRVITRVERDHFNGHLI